MTTRTDHAAELKHVLDVVFALPPQHAIRDALARARIVSVGQLLQLALGRVGGHTHQGSRLSGQVVVRIAIVAVRLDLTPVLCDSGGGVETTVRHRGSASTESGETTARDGKACHRMHYPNGASFVASGRVVDLILIEVEENAVVDLLGHLDSNAKADTIVDRLDAIIGAIVLVDMVVSCRTMSHGERTLWKKEVGFGKWSKVVLLFGLLRML